MRSYGFFSVTPMTLNKVFIFLEIFVNIFQSILFWISLFSHLSRTFDLYNKKTLC